MRVLHLWNDHVGGRLAVEERRSVRSRDRAIPGGKRLPLRNVSADHRRDPAGRRRSERSLPMNELTAPHMKDSNDTLEARPLFQQTIDPERYGFHAEPRYQFALDRRDFLRLVGGGIVVGLVLNEAGAFQPPGRRGGRGFGQPMPQELSAWLHV